MCNASAHGRSVAWRVTCYASVHDVSMPHPTPPPCSRLIRRLKHCTYEKYGDIKIQHTLTGRRINRLPQTTVGFQWVSLFFINSGGIMKHGCWHQGAKNGHNATHSEGIEGLWEPENTWPILTKESRHMSKLMFLDVSGLLYWNILHLWIAIWNKLSLLARKLARNRCVVLRPSEGALQSTVDRWERN